MKFCLQKFLSCYLLKIKLLMSTKHDLLSTEDELVYINKNDYLQSTEDEVVDQPNMRYLISSEGKIGIDQIYFRSCLVYTNHFFFNLLLLKTKLLISTKYDSYYSPKIKLLIWTTYDLGPSCMLESNLIKEINDLVATYGISGPT